MCAWSGKIYSGVMATYLKKIMNKAYSSQIFRIRIFQKFWERLEELLDCSIFVSSIPKQHIYLSHENTLIDCWKNIFKHKRCYVLYHLNIIFFSVFTGEDVNKQDRLCVIDKNQYIFSRILIKKNKNTIVMIRFKQTDLGTDLFDIDWS